MSIERLKQDPDASLQVVSQAAAESGACSQPGRDQLLAAEILAPVGAQHLTCATLS